MSVPKVSDPTHPPEVPGDQDFAVWFFSLYGATMLAVQLMEFYVSFLYMVANVDFDRGTNASSQRQFRNATRRMWSAFQTGSTGMRLNDATRGIRDHISPELHAELDAFVKGPRNKLAHRYLLERVAFIEHGGKQHLAVAAGELLKVTLQANRLREQLDARAQEIRSTWPESSEPPDDVKQAIEDTVRITTLSQYPDGVLEYARQAQAKRDQERAKRDEGSS